MAISQPRDFIATGKWREFDQWKCKLCNFDTLDGEEIAVDHVVNVHLNPQVKEQVTSQVLLVDSHGNPVGEIAERQLLSFLENSTIEEVIAAVEGRAFNAQAVLRTEQSRPESDQRKTLIEQLEKLIK